MNTLLSFLGLNIAIFGNIIPFQSINDTHYDSTLYYITNVNPMWTLKELKDKIFEQMNDIEIMDDIEKSQYKLYVKNGKYLDEDSCVKEAILLNEKQVVKLKKIPSIEITLKTMNGQQYTINEVDSTNTIYDVKRMVKKHLGYRYDVQRISDDDKVYHNDWSLGDLSNTALSLVISLPNAIPVTAYFTTSNGIDVYRFKRLRRIELNSEWNSLNDMKEYISTEYLGDINWKDNIIFLKCNNDHFLNDIQVDIVFDYESLVKTDISPLNINDDNSIVILLISDMDVESINLFLLSEYATNKDERNHFFKDFLDHAKDIVEHWQKNRLNAYVANLVNRLRNVRLNLIAGNIDFAEQALDEATQAAEHFFDEITE